MKNNNQINVPQAREAMDKFKMQAAQEVGVNLTNGYNGHLTSREAGSVGGQMVKNKCPVRTMSFTRHNRIAMGHIQTVQYKQELKSNKSCCLFLTLPHRTAIYKNARW